MCPHFVLYNFYPTFLYTEKHSKLISSDKNGNMSSTIITVGILLHRKRVYSCSSSFEQLFTHKS